MATMDNNKAAVALYDKAISLKPDYIWAYGNRGSTKDGVGHYKSALRDLGMALNWIPLFKIYITA